MGQIAQDTGIVGIILHDQQDAVVRLQILTVVSNLLDRMFDYNRCYVAAARPRKVPCPPQGDTELEGPT